MLTLVQAIDKVKRLEGIPERILEIAREEAPEGRTAHIGTYRQSLKESLYCRKLTSRTWIIGTDVPYAEYVEHGRGPIYPKPGGKTGKPGRPRRQRKALHYIDYMGQGTSIHDWGNPGEHVFLPYAGPTRPNPFMERTRQRAIEMIRNGDY